MNPRIPLLSFSIALTCAPGCSHGSLDRAIRETLPRQYTPRKPVNSKPQLGRRLVPTTGVPEINVCYVGVLATPDPSWSNVTVTYKRATQVAVGADFGNLVGLTGEVEDTVSGAVVLKGTRIFELQSLSFLPASGCADGAMRDAYRKGKADRVIAVAVWAREIDARNSRTSKVKLQPEVKVLPSNVNVKAEINNVSELEVKLDGSGLFYAQRIDEVTTTLTDFEQTIAAGQSTNKLDACRFFLSGFGDDPSGKRLWSGKLICDGAVEHTLNGELNGSVSAASTASGVSYSVFVADTDTLGKARVELSRWTVVQPQ